jgi:hypothetical protein
LTATSRTEKAENVKKPKHRKTFATGRDCERLVCSLGTKVVVITAADFERIWKLAKEAVHFNGATRTGTFE